MAVSVAAAGWWTVGRGVYVWCACKCMCALHVCAHAILKCYENA